MAFNINAARQSWATDDDIINYLTKTRKFDVQWALNSGASKEQIINYLSSTKPKWGSVIWAISKGADFLVDNPLTKVVWAWIWQVVSWIWWWIGAAVWATWQIIKNVAEWEKPFQQNVLESAVREWEATAKFGREIWKSWWQSAPTLLYWAWINAIIAANQWYKSVKEITEWLKTWDTSKLVSWGVSLWLSAAWARWVARWFKQVAEWTSISKRFANALIDPDAMSAIKNQYQYLWEQRTAKLLDSYLIRNENTWNTSMDAISKNTKDKLLKKWIKIWDDLTNQWFVPTIRKSSRTNKQVFDTTDVRNNYRTRIQTEQELIEAQMASSWANVNLMDWWRKSLKYINDNVASAADRKIARSKVIEYIKEEVSWWNVSIPADKANSLAKYFWKKWFNVSSKSKDEVASALNMWLKDAIADSVSETLKKEYLKAKSNYANWKVIDTALKELNWKTVSPTISSWAWRFVYKVWKAWAYVAGWSAWGFPWAVIAWEAYEAATPKIMWLITPSNERVIRRLASEQQRLIKKWKLDTTWILLK